MKTVFTWWKFRFCLGAFHKGRPETKPFGIFEKPSNCTSRVCGPTTNPYRPRFRRKWWRWPFDELPVVSGRAAVKAFAKAGYEIDRRRGSPHHSAQERSTPPPFGHSRPSRDREGHAQIADPGSGTHTGRILRSAVTLADERPFKKRKLRAIRGTRSEFRIQNSGGGPKEARRRRISA